MEPLRVYAMMAVEAEMIGFTTTSTGMATVAAYGSNKPGTANNAVAWGVPTRSGAPFVLDMACGVSAWGKVESWKMYGYKMPPNWGLDADGQPTDDPHAAKTLLALRGGSRLWDGLSVVGAGGLPGRRSHAPSQKRQLYGRRLRALLLRDRYPAIRRSG